MLNLSSMPDTTLLRQWAYYSGVKPYEELAEYINRLGYRVFVRSSPASRTVTPQDIRRLLKKILKKSQRYPTNRPPTRRDYDLLKIDIITSEDDRLS